MSVIENLSRTQPESMSQEVTQIFIDKSLYTFLFNAQALFFGDEIELVLTGDLAYEKINTPEGKQYLSALFSGVQGTQLRVVVSKKGNLKQRDGQASVMDIAAKKDILGDKMTVVEE